jgi:hypothetical protein
MRRLVTLQDAQEMAWTAFLDEVGEPPIPNWYGTGFLVGHLVPFVGRVEDEEHWRIMIHDFRERGPNSVVACVWVAKQTGHCNVWVNESYEPTGEAVVTWSSHQRYHCPGSA